MEDDGEERLLGQFIPLHYHGQMLADARRVAPFKEAIEKLVTPGAHVVELGAGTGVMSFFAAQRARKVSCVERLPQSAAAARRLLSANGVAHKVTVFEADARSFVPDEPADVVICEMLHAGLLREKQLAVLRAFRANHRQRFGRDVPRFIPEATLLAVQPVHQPYDFHGYRAPLPLFFEAGSLNADTVELGPPLLYATVDYLGALPERFAWDAPCSIARDGELNALRFITKNVVGIFPAEQRSADWHMHYLSLPLPRALHVRAGDAVQLSFAYEAGASIEALVASLRAG